MTPDELREALARAFILDMQEQAKETGMFVDEGSDRVGFIIDGFFDINRAIAAAIAAIREAGFAIVPVVPTEGMLKAGAPHEAALQAFMDDLVNQAKEEGDYISYKSTIDRFDLEGAFDFRRAIAAYEAAQEGTP